MARSLRRRANAAPPAPTKTSRNNKQPEAPPEQNRLQQIREVWSATRAVDPRTPYIVFVPVVVVIAVLVVVGVLIGHIIIFAILALLGGMLTGTSIFGRRASAAMYSRVEGQPGAGAAVLQGLRGDWRVTPAVGFTRNQDLVHRAIGRPGIVLVGEGSPNAVRPLITDQKRRIGRVAPDTPIYEVLIGDGEGQVSIAKLQRHMIKLPRNLKKNELNGVEARMKALGGPNVPIPKGPMPTRMPRGKMR